MAVRQLFAVKAAETVAGTLPITQLFLPVKSQTYRLKARVNLFLAKSRSITCIQYYWQSCDVLQRHPELLYSSQMDQIFNCLSPFQCSSSVRLQRGPVFTVLSQFVFRMCRKCTSFGLQQVYYSIILHLRLLQCDCTSIKRAPEESSSRSCVTLVHCSPAQYYFQWSA